MLVDQKSTLFNVYLSKDVSTARGNFFPSIGPTMLVAVSLASCDASLHMTKQNEQHKPNFLFLFSLTYRNCP